MNPTRKKILHHDCAKMLQTRFVLFVENLMIRYYSITNFVWMMYPVSSCLSERFLHGSRTVCVRLQTSQFGSIGAVQKQCACQLACTRLVNWTFPRIQEHRLLGHLGLAGGHPMPQRGHWVYEFFSEMPPLAHDSHTRTCSSFHLESTLETLTCSIHMSCPCLRIINPEIALLVNLPTASQ